MRQHPKSKELASDLVNASLPRRVNYRRAARATAAFTTARGQILRLRTLRVRRSG